MSKTMNEWHHRRGHGGEEPDYAGDYLVTYESGDVGIHYWNGGWDGYDPWETPDEVVAWQPLPEPYEPEGLRVREKSP